MKYINKRGVDMSVFTLGTVQLGMDYGLVGSTSKPSKEFAFKLLDKTVEKGVNILDTANNYGDSEKVIGEWMQTIDESKRPMIVTKIGPLDHSSDEACRADILAQTKKCLETLGVSTIDVLMDHYYEDYDAHPEVLCQTFEEMKKMGWIRYSGVSVYSHHDYKKVAASGLDAVQIPFNIFDWGQIESGGLDALAEADMMVFARSVFLQGIIFNTPEQIDPRMDFCVPYIKKFREFCDEFKMTPPVLAMSFALSIPAISAVVLGCQTPDQVEGNCQMVDQVRLLTPEELAKIREAFVNIDPRVINPGLWFNAQQKK
jgi:aryl-alcohol dehydrogenase-like predicted oxidoreductase